MAMNLLAAAMSVGCGQSNENSKISAITPPDRREVSNVESFWLYENRSLADQNWIPLQASTTKYFPELMPSNGTDFFWVADNVSPSTVPDRFERHAEGTLPRMEFKSAAAYSYQTFHHSLFDDMDVLRTDYALTPTLEIKGRIGDQLAVDFTINQVCFKLDPTSPEFLVVLPSRKVISKILTISRPLFETETYVLDSSYSAAEYASFKAECVKAGAAEIASTFDIDLKPVTVTSPIVVDFPGIFVKRIIKN
jgi:hypothetical protein